VINHPQPPAGAEQALRWRGIKKRGVQKGKNKLIPLKV